MRSEDDRRDRIGAPSHDTTTDRKSAEDPVFLTKAELAQRWRACPRWLERWRNKGEIPQPFQIGRKVLYRLSDIKAYEDLLIQKAKDDLASVRGPGGAP